MGWGLIPMVNQEKVFKSRISKIVDIPLVFFFNSKILNFIFLSTCLYSYRRKIFIITMNDFKNAKITFHFITKYKNQIIDDSSTDFSQPMEMIIDKAFILPSWETNLKMMMEKM